MSISSTPVRYTWKNGMPRKLVEPPPLPAPILFEPEWITALTWVCSWSACAFVLIALLLGCGSDAGGSPLSSDDEPCPGTLQGPAGPQGEPGADGSDGLDGADGADTVTGVRKSMLCQIDDHLTFVSVYLWDVGGADEEHWDSQDMGLCFITEGIYSQTKPVIGSTCSLMSTRLLALVYLDLSTDPPTASGALAGAMNCY